MERNWLIRTTQFQILGPISKDKVVEFYKKGALGPDDELCSGNGYWFSIKEKDLVEKYLIGDIPQGFNPISEAPTVLAAKKKSEHTSTLNRSIKAESPAQDASDSQSNATQVINLKDLKNSEPPVPKEEIKVPKNDDLDYPDMGSVKVPKNDDLDYPDMGALKVPKSDDLDYPSVNQVSSKASEPVKKEATAPKYKMQSAEDILPEKMEPVHLPKEEDLAYPDLTPVKNQKDFKVEDIKAESGLKLAEKKEAPPLDEATKTQFMATSPGSAKAVLVPSQPAKAEIAKPELPKPETKQLQVKPQDERKLLVERKKASVKESSTQEISRKDLKKSNKENSTSIPKRNDTYFFLIVALLVIIILGVLFYYREILNKPLPV